MKRHLLAALVVMALIPMTTAASLAAPGFDPGYRGVLTKTVAMVHDHVAQRLANAMKLNILNVTWEDTGRYKGSAVGPNISDMTIQVEHRPPGADRGQLYLMPVIRSPNFSDRSADIKLDDFHLLVGNQRGEDLQRVSLRELLANLRPYLSDPRSWKGEESSLLAERDTHALVSAQAAFLPIPKRGKATFNPVLFNYQSTAGDPAVLTILATREGTSVTVIDNTRDAFASGGVWGQRLFFNANGQRASLTGKRLSDFKAAGGDATSPGHTASGEEGLNMVMLIQVPLKQKNPMRFDAVADGLAFGAGMPKSAAVEERGASDVEAAVIGHGKVEGPFTEIDGLAIERDERFPVRVTVQFYKATSNGVVSKQDLRDIRAQIDRVYADADYVGSLVTEGHTQRPTEYDGNKVEPADWWQSFWQRYEQNMGMDRRSARELMWHLFQPGWVARPYGARRFTLTAPDGSVPDRAPVTE